jgi:hypothetical protein
MAALQAMDDGLFSVKFYLQNQIVSSRDKSDGFDYEI